MIRLHAHPFPPPPQPRRQVASQSLFQCVSPVGYWQEMGRGVWAWSRINDRKKAWSSINRAIRYSLMVPKEGFPYTFQCSKFGIQKKETWHGTWDDAQYASRWSLRWRRAGRREHGCDWWSRTSRELFTQSKILDEIKFPKQFSALILKLLFDASRILRWQKDAVYRIQMSIA